MMIIHIVVAGALAWCSAILPMARTNLFRAYDFLLLPPPMPPHYSQLCVTYEGAYHVRAFDACSGDERDVLKIWQNTQDGIAALKGLPDGNPITEYAQTLNINDDNGMHGIFVPHGKLSIPMNLLFAARHQLPYNITLGLYWSVVTMELHDVWWKEKHNDTSFEDIATPDLLQNLAKLGHLNLKGWKKTGFTDLAAIANWYQVFPQNKPWLKKVPLGLKLGLLFPTGAKPNENDLLRQPFGYYGGVGLIFGGTLGLIFKHHMGLWMDLHFLHLFGNTAEQRIKTNPLQTDLLLLTKARAFNDPGFLQRYTLGLSRGHFFHRDLTGMISYQYQKKNDDTLYPCEPISSPPVINDAESLQEWTTHSIILTLMYQRPYFDEAHECRRFVPQVQLFTKIGFNGKRALIADSSGLQLSFAF